jgi:exonuclease 3'-5' domain-containing protein 1
MQHILSSSTVVTGLKKSVSIVKGLQQAGHPIALDLEGVNLGPTGPATLVQVGTPAGQVFLFDVQTCPELVGRGGLKQLLEDENITKVRTRAELLVFLRTNWFRLFTRV